MKIPEQLHDWRFILLKARDKIPTEREWPTKNNYCHDDPKLLEHLERGGNYGVIGDAEHFIIDGDIPEIQQAVEKNLPATFTVRTPGHAGKHYYFRGKLSKPIRLRDKEGKNVGDVQGVGKQVVGPWCIHPNGGKYQIVATWMPARITEEQLRAALADFILEDPLVGGSTAAGQEVPKSAGEARGIKITDVCPLEGMRRQGDEYYGSHLTHGSDTGHNFWINPAKNTWICFRHNTGGGPLSLLAVKEGIIKCEEATKGALRGEKFNRALDVARERGLIMSFRVKPWRVIHA